MTRQIVPMEAFLGVLRIKTMIQSENAAVVAKATQPQAGHHDGLRTLSLYHDHVESIVDATAHNCAIICDCLSGQTSYPATWVL
jgi:hypothetical protein